jgi:DeoR family glycerol-3-phosphate regulon repressor
MKPEERQEMIVDLISRRERVSVEELAQKLEISRETIRRDLTRLDREGVLRKVHGGAMRLQNGAARRAAAQVDEGPFHARVELNVEAKRAIARGAASLLSAGESLFIDTGSTTLYFAEAISSHKSLTIITNSGDIAAHTGRGEGAKVYLIGGEYRAGGHECLGAMAIQQINEMRAAHAFLAVGSIDASGFMDFDLQEAHVARAMVARAASVTLLADGSKFRTPAVFPVAGLDAVDRIVTDEIPAELRAEIEKQGVEVIVVKA